jgi:hypothetical protein
MQQLLGVGQWQPQHQTWAVGTQLTCQEQHILTEGGARDATQHVKSPLVNVQVLQHRHRQECAWLHMMPVMKPSQEIMHYQLAGGTWYSQRVPGCGGNLGRVWW